MRKKYPRKEITLLLHKVIPNLPVYSDYISQLMVENGIVYAGTSNGTVQALNAKDGNMLWHYVIQQLAVPTNPIYGAYVHFSDGVSFQQAIHLLSDPGLQTFANCAFQWKPQGSGEGFSTDRWLVVAATVNSAPLWFNRLQAAPDEC